MMSAGFQWGQEAPKAPNFSGGFQPQHTFAKSNKRRLDDDDEINEIRQFGGKYRALYNDRSGARRMAPNKRSRTPKIIGQTLPVHRLVEVLDHKSLQNLVNQLLMVHPEITSTINKFSAKPTLQDSINLLQQKFDSITSYLPYKCDIESDYSYLRVKPYINEFLNCVSDFILNFLPPIESNSINSLTFLNFITELIHNLPKFSSSEFQYIKNMAYEQIANTWMIVLTIDDENDENELESISKLIKIIKQLDLESKLEIHNENSLGKFTHVLEYIKSQIDQYDQVNAIGNTSGGALGDLITVDYSNYSLTARTSN
jgi:protein Cut8